ADFPYVSVEALEELCKEIDELLDLCNCYEDEHEEKLKTKRKNTELKKQVIAKDLEFKELIKGNVTNEAKLEVSEEKTKELKSEIKPIREENLQKTKELAEKEAEIFSLHRQLAQCKVKASDSELNLAEKELNNIAKRFEIEKKHKKELCDVYRQLVRLREKRGDNKTEIDNAEKKKADILDELEKKIDDENNVLDFSRQCEKVEVLKFQLEEFKQQQRQLEAHQEYRRP
ncbi:18242_t:CDS:1, partial [Racocetra persica]